MEMNLIGRVQTLVVHHSATATGDVDSFRRWHRAQGFADVGYHAVITKDGETQPGRSEQFQGAAVKLANRGKLHVCLVGNFEREEPTRVQLAALGWWLVGRQRRYGSRDLEGLLAVGGHREVALAAHPTLCPGEWFRSRMGRLREWCLSFLEGRTEVGLDDWFFGTVAAARPRLDPITARVVWGNTEFQPQAILVDGSTFVNLRDLAAGAGWEEPRLLTEDDGRKVVEVLARPPVRPTLTGDVR